MVYIGYGFGEIMLRLATPGYLRFSQARQYEATFGGERNRLHLALTLKDEGNVLLLDEPTNDVDVNTIQTYPTVPSW